MEVAIEMSPYSASSQKPQAPKKLFLSCGFLLHLHTFISSLCLPWGPSHDEAKKNLLLPLYRWDLTQRGCHTIYYFLLNPKFNKVKPNKVQVSIRPIVSLGFMVTCLPLDRVLDITILSYYKMCFTQLVFGLTCPISSLQEQFISQIKQITLSESLS